MREFGYPRYQRQNSATLPAQEKLFVTFDPQPWNLKMAINASNVSVGVTVQDVQVQIYSVLMAYTSRAEFEGQDEERRNNIEQSFWNNRSSEASLPDASRLGPGIRLFDWLGEQTMFGGLVLEDRREILEQFSPDEAHVPVLRLLCTSDVNAEAQCKCYCLALWSR